MSSVSKNFERKRKAFTGVKNMTLITPSKWLADLTRQSFLKEYPVEVHYNTIDTSIFKPTPSDFRERYGLQDKIIVLVGLSEKQIKDLPKNIKGIQRTNSPQELAAIYTAADVFVNPTYEDNYPTVNLEAQACGTRVITYDTGGCKETLNTKESTLVQAGAIQVVAEMIEEKA